MDKWKRALLFLWQLPQCLLALALIAIYKAQFREEYRSVRIYTLPDAASISGCSLGLFILLKSFSDETTLKHEYGHTRQSLIFGPSTSP